MLKFQRTIIVLILCLVFTTLFLNYTKKDFPLIFKKDMLAHDESSNSTVAANISRKFFPPMVRVNPLVEDQGNWMEGPYWQHIPPLFAYVPYVFFQLDGGVTIEIKRLSYAFLIWLTAIIFILSVYLFRKSLFAAGAATIATIFWISTPFTHELVTGFAFGVSDIVLSFTVICAFAGLLWYLKEPKENRLNYPLWKFIAIGALVALPVVAKNLLGAIAPAVFFILLLIDFRSLNKRIFVAAGSFVAILIAYLLPLYISSPETFKNEVMISIFHAADYEGWGRPWHHFLTNYLPQRYLFGWTWVFYAGLIGGLTYYGLRMKKFERKDKVMLGLTSLWFVWNLVAISLVESKIANFVFQSYILILFFVVYGTCLFLSSRAQRLAKSRDLFHKLYVMDSSTPARLMLLKSVGMTLIVMLTISLLVTGYEAVRFQKAFVVAREQAFLSYPTEREKFYQTAEHLKQIGTNQNDIVIIRVSDNDCWGRYPIMFLTGAESKTLLEMYFYIAQNENLDLSKYRNLYFILNKSGPFPELDAHEVQATGEYFLIKYDLSRLTPEEPTSVISAFLDVYENSIALDVERIKQDKTSCQWLVPDPILNDHREFRL